MNQGLYIIGSNITGVCRGAAPETIADKYPSWRKSIKRYGPWEPVLLNEQADKTRIDAWCGTGYLGTETVFICEKCSSTMDLMRNLSAHGLAKSWDSIITVSQSAGRGQHGRGWVSSSGNLFASWLWPQFEQNLESTGRWKNMASLIAGGAIADFFTTAGFFVEVKWPNDILYNGKKICGILVEDCEGSMIVGVGINIKTAPENDLLLKDGSVPATFLLAAGKTYAPLDLWLEIMTDTRAFYSRMTCHAGPDLFIKWLENKLAWKNRSILIRELPDGDIKAELSGLAPDGGLEISRNGRIEVIYNGRIFPIS